MLTEKHCSFHAESRKGEEMVVNFIPVYRSKYNKYPNNQIKSRSKLAPVFTPIERQSLLCISCEAKPVDRTPSTIRIGDCHSVWLMFTPLSKSKANDRFLAKLLTVNTFWAMQGNPRIIDY